MQEPNNIREDLDLFNQISDLFLQDELDSPVANYISPENLLKDLDLSLNDNPEYFSFILKISSIYSIEFVNIKRIM